MKKFYKILCLILAMIFVLSAFSACKNDTDGDDNGETTDTPAADTPAETPGETGGDTSGDAEPETPGASSESTPDENATLINIDAKYVIIRPETCSDDVKAAAVELKNALAAVTGASVTLKEDFLYGDSQPDQYEILIGQTNREESAKAIEDLKYNDYTVEVAGDKLVITAYTDEKLLEAVEYVKGLFANATGSVAIKEDDQKTVKAEYKFDQIKFGDTSLAGYSIIIPSKATGIIESYATKLQAKILENSGVLLPIKTDLKEETAKEILLGNTNRNESKAVKQAALPTNGYAIKASGSKIVVKSKDDGFTFVKTVMNIMAEMENGAFNAGEGKLVLNNDPVFTAFCFTDVHNNFAMLEPTNSTGDYIVRKNVDGMIDHMIATEGKVDLVMVGGDLMSDYPSWNSSGNWPYAYFVEYRQLLIDTFSRLAKDGKTVTFNGGNHDYGQGEAATDAPHTPTGNYNSTDFYFGDAGMRQNIGELAEEDMFWKIGEHTGDKYLIAYHYVMNGIHVMGLAPDPDHPGVWSSQGDGFSDESLEWLDKKLDEIDPYGTEIIFVNCHYPLDNVYEDANDYGKLSITHNSYTYSKLSPIYKGHKNLFHFFGHWESYYHDYSVKGVIHHNMSGNAVLMKGTETSSLSVLEYAYRGFNSVNMGHFRPMYNSRPHYFKMDSIQGYGGYDKYAVQHGSTRTPRVAQGMYVQVYENRIVFTMKNYGDYKSFETETVLQPYTVWLYQ